MYNKYNSSTVIVLQRLLNRALRPLFLTAIYRYERGKHMGKYKIGVIDVGGGTRGIYGAGFFDYCMDQNITFDHLIGVSAGGANICSFAAGQRGRNLRFYDGYAFRKEYMSLRNFRKTHNYIDLDYIYSTLSNEDGEDPVDYDALKNNPTTMEFVATDARTGRPVYFSKHDLHRNQYDPLKASSCVPLINRPYPIGNSLYLDGGIADPIPLKHAFERGLDQVIVILTRPREYLRSTKRDKLAVASLARKYPAAAQALARRARLYNHQLEVAKRLEKKNRVLIISPESIGNLKTLSQDHEQLEKLYDAGYMDAVKIKDFIR